MTNFDNYKTIGSVKSPRASSITNNLDDIDKYDNTFKRIRFNDPLPLPNNQTCNNYEAIGNESQSIYTINNNYSISSDYSNSLDKDNYLQAQTPKIPLRQASVVSTGAYRSTASLLSPESQRIRLGNENFVISIQPFKFTGGQSLCEESETDNTKVTDETLANNSQQTILKNKPKQSNDDDDDDSSSTSNSERNGPKVSYICFFCRCFFRILNFFLKCLSCCGSCLCTPCFCAAMFGAVAAALAVVCMGFFGIIPIPITWTENICTDQQRFLFNNQTFVNHTNFYNTTLSTNYTTTKMITNSSVNISTQSRLQIIQNKQIAELEEQLDKALQCETPFNELNLDWIALNYSILLLPHFNDIQVDIVEDSKFQQVNDGDLEMKINLEIDIFCNKSSKILKVETRDFSNINITIENDLNIYVVDWSYDPLSNLLLINLNKECSPKSKYHLTIFVLYKNYGLQNEKSNRFSQKYYLTNFNSKQNTPFPILSYGSNCSSAKSIFNLTLVRLPSQHQVMFSMDVSSSFAKNGLQFTNYKITPYIRVKTLAISIGRFNCRDKKYTLSSKDSLRISLCSLVLFNDQMERVLSYTSSIIEFYRNYTQKDYPLSKIDILVLPNEDENEDANHLGFIYLSLKLINQMYNTDDLIRTQIKSKVIYSIAKQIARHWFYGLSDCSCSLWNNINSQMDQFKALNLYLSDDSYNSNNSKLDYNQNCFLQNGLTTWLSFMGLQLLQPEIYDLLELEWYMLRKMELKSFSVYQSSTYFYFDYNFVKLSSSENIIKTKIELKSVEIIKTLYLLFGPQKFQMILMRLFKHSGANFVDFKRNDVDFEEILFNEVFNRRKRDESLMDLLELFSKQYNLLQQSNNNITLKNVILSWIISDNDMVLSINRNYNKRQALIGLDLLKLKNSSYSYPFIWSKFEVKSDTNEITQEISLSKDLALKNENSNLIWIQSSINNLRDLPGADKFIIANYLRAFSSFRVNYDSQNWALIIEQLKRNHLAFNIFDRNQIIDDSFYLSNYGRLSINIALDLLEYLPYERYYLPWKIAIDNLKHLISYIQDDSSTYGVLREYIIRLFESTYKRLKWGESPLDTFDEKLIRILVVDLMCMLDYEECVENSVKQLNDNIRINVNNIPQHLSKSVLCTAVRYTGIKEWDYLWSLYSSQPQIQRNHALLLSLSCSSQIWILNLLLQRLVYENYLQKNDLPIAFEYISQNPIGKYIAWNHISQNYQKFYNQIGNDPELFVKLIEISTRQFKFKYEVKQVYDFMQSIGLANFTNIDDKNIFKKIELRINMYSNWNNWNLKDINEWLLKKLKKLKQ